MFLPIVQGPFRTGDDDSTSGGGGSGSGGGNTGGGGGAGSSPTTFDFDVTNVTSDYNLQQDLISRGHDGVSAVNVTLELGTFFNPITLNASSTSTAAFTAHLPVGSTLNLTIQGDVIGKGGAGGAPQSDTRFQGNPGGAGGHAISLENVTANITLKSFSSIKGGGGGAGSGGASKGNGSFIAEGDGGCQFPQTPVPGGSGGSGAGPNPATAGSNNGGNGGDFGSVGQAGTAGSAVGACAVNTAGGDPGAAGKAIHHVANVTQTLTVQAASTVAGATS